MRDLAQNEIKAVPGALGLEGWVTDDFALIGSAIGFTASVGIGYFGKKHYGEPPITVFEACSCILFTAIEFMQFGVCIDTFQHLIASKN